MKDDFARNMNLQMRYVMPIFIVFIAYSLSATIALYFFVSNLVAIAQEFYVRKHR
jgi:membrane protein insertase Oxa1/YidC/SpoIIIJ